MSQTNLDQGNRKKEMVAERQEQSEHFEVLMETNAEDQNCNELNAEDNGEESIVKYQ